jgi:hypothetical protein
MLCQRFPALVVPLTIAALCLPAIDVFPRGGYPSPPAQHSTPVKPVADLISPPGSATPGAPLNRTYTWYAPPAGYQVIREGTPSQPRFVTVVGPDGKARTFRLEGPVVVRFHYVSVRQGSP